LPAKADCGLILFNHEPVVSVPPPADRALLRKHVEDAIPKGGTAYLDATFRAIEMLKPSIFNNKAKAVVLLTDGVDIDSNVEIERVIAAAKLGNVRIYTVGIGEPGRQEKVTSVMVLDKSGSMNQPANDQDKGSKIQALRLAASRFVKSIGSTRRTSILEFSDAVQNPTPFTNNKFTLKGAINGITAKGETALFDAVYTAVATLDAEGTDGKRAVVALTDGIDNMSRRRVDEVIARAKEAKIPLFMLGFGRKGELDVATMEDMARQTGGKFYYAGNEKELIELFEDLTIKLHDDGINEGELTQLARDTGGKYYSAKNVEKLDFILEQVTKKLQAMPQTETFASLSQVADGRRREVTLKLLRGSQVVAEKKRGYQVHGLVIAEMNPLVYLPLLGILFGLIALPAMLRRRTSAT
jgi:VWFA-related protein